MKRYIVLLAAALALGGCYKEGSLTPSQIGSAADKFEFPQADTPAAAQAVIEEIYDKYGVKVIYKDFTVADLGHSWTTLPGGTVEYKWDEITDPDKLLEAVTVVRDKVLGIFPAERMKPVLKSFSYLYLADGLHYEQMSSSGMQTYVVPVYPKAMDGLGINLNINAATGPWGKVRSAAIVAANVFDVAYSAGVFTMTDEFLNEVDGNRSNDYLCSYSESRDPANVNRTIDDYWAQRGFLPDVQEPGILMGKHSYNKRMINSATNFSSVNLEVPKAFLYMSVDPNWDSALFNEEDGVSDNTLQGIYRGTRLSTRLKMFYNAMKAQGIDMKEVCAAMYKNSGMDTDPSRIFIRKVTPNAEQGKFIYYDFNEN